MASEKKKDDEEAALVPNRMQTTFYEAEEEEEDEVTSFLWVIRNHRLKRYIITRLFDIITDLQGDSMRSSLNRMLSYYHVEFDNILFRTLHIIITLVIWSHFFYIKFHVQKAALQNPEAPNYWWKRLTPPLEFGAMHAILFQLALIPLTMSRYTLAVLSTSDSFRWFPFQHLVQFHIQIGYTFCFIMVLSVIFFFAFFGKVCHNAKDPHHKEPAVNYLFCEKFESEIMITGYCILACTLIVLFTSLLRGKLTYKQFYFPHLLMLAMYGLATVHTLDDEFREEDKQRSQTFKWFAASLSLYYADRLCRKTLATWKNVKIKSARIPSDGLAFVLHLKRPYNFNFSSGQYAVLSSPDIDILGHPFSIASASDSDNLSFLIEVKGVNSWTRNLRDLLVQKKIKSLTISGPYGYPVSDIKTDTTIIAVGTGTGVVPMYSLMHQFMNHIGRLGLHVFTSDKAAGLMSRKAAKFGHLQRDFTHHQKLLVENIQLRIRRKGLDKGADSKYVAGVRHNHTLSMVLLWSEAFTLFLISWEVALMGFSVSWANLELAGVSLKIPVTAGMTDFLTVSTWVLILIFPFLMALRFKQRENGHSKVNIMFDALAWVFMFSITVYWTDSDKFKIPTDSDIILRFFFGAFRVFRMLHWRSYMQIATASESGMDGAERFHLIQICRSASLVRQYIDVLSNSMDDLEMKLYGKVYGKPGGKSWIVGNKSFKFLRVSIFVTDKHAGNVEKLKLQLKGTRLESCVYYGRPDLEQITRDAMLERVIDTANPFNRVSSQMLMTFCGSPIVADALFANVIKYNTIAKDCNTGVKYRFRAESYGIGVKGNTAVVGDANQLRSDGGKGRRRASIVYFADEKEMGTMKQGDGQVKVAVTAETDA